MLNLFVVQTVSPVTVHLMADGLNLVHAQKLVAAGLSVEHAAVLRPQMAAVIVQAMRSSRAIRKPAQVHLLALMR